jgi:hypothetical protein
MRNFETELLVNTNAFPAQIPQTFADLLQLAIWGHMEHTLPKAKWTVTFDVGSTATRSSSAGKFALPSFLQIMRAKCIPTQSRAAVTSVLSSI